MLSFSFESKFSDEERKYNAPFEGVIPNLERRLSNSPSELIREKIQKYVIEKSCPECHGARLKKEILSITVGNKKYF